jgi:hypothetical protein
MIKLSPYVMVECLEWGTCISPRTLWNYVEWGIPHVEFGLFPSCQNSGVDDNTVLDQTSA